MELEARSVMLKVQPGSVSVRQPDSSVVLPDSKGMT